MTRRVVGVAVVMNRADEGQLVHDLGLLGHWLAELNSGNVGVDRSQWSAVLGWSLWFRIVRFKLSRAAGQLDEDDRCLAVRDAGFGAMCQNLWQCQRAKAKKAYAKEAAAVDAVTSRKRIDR